MLRTFDRSKANLDAPGSAIDGRAVVQSIAKHASQLGRAAAEVPITVAGRHWGGIRPAFQF